MTFHINNVYTTDAEILVLYAVVGIIATVAGWIRTNTFPCFNPSVVEPFSAFTSSLYLVAGLEGYHPAITITSAVLAAASTMLHATERGDARTIDHAFAILLPIVVIITLSEFNQKIREAALTLSGCATTMAAILGTTHAWQYGFIGYIVVLIIIWATTSTIKPQWATVTVIVITMGVAITIKIAPNYAFCDTKRDVVHSLWHMLTSVSTILLIRLLTSKKTPQAILKIIVAFDVTIVVFVAVDALNYKNYMGPVTIVYQLLLVATSFKSQSSPKQHVLLQSIL
jgi:hypothetical protein